MTNEYKQNILDYITNNIVPTSKSDTQILEREEQLERNDFLPFLPINWADFRFEGVVKSITNGNYVLYGGYVPRGTTADVDSRGIIMILDNNLTPIKTFYQFNTGTYLRPIQKLIQIDDGTFVGVDSTIFSPRESRSGVRNNPKRFIMLNNISAADSTNEYRAILRTSYYLQNPNFYCIDMIKNPNTSHYVMTGATSTIVNGDHYDGVRLIELKINVGEPNEWIEKTLDASKSWIYGGFYGEFDNNDNLDFKIIATLNFGTVELVSWDGNTTKSILTAASGINPYVDSLSMENQVVFANKNEAYFVINNQRFGAEVVPRYVGLYKYNYSNSGLKQIYFKNIGDYDYNGSREGIFLNSLNGEIYINYNDNFNYTDRTANYNYQRLTNDTWQPILIAENVKYVMERLVNFTGNTYNLITNLSINANPNVSGWHFIRIEEIFNSANYNSTPYQDYNSMVPRYTNLYDTNGIVFSRNLYNLTIYNSTSTSTVQVPNTLLNNTTITQEKLVGETNSILINEIRNIEKNIYETLYINFINTLNVEDEDTDTIYQTTANYITQNINVGSKDNCQNTFVGKVRVNYENSQRVQSITWSWNNDHYETEFMIDATQEVPTLDFMSNDESTIYLTKELDIATGNYYIIKQKLRIE